MDSKNPDDSAADPAADVHAGPAGLARLPAVARLIELAIDEDLGRGDVTTASVLGPHTATAAAAPARATIAARQDLVVFGLDIASDVFRRIEPAARVSYRARDGDRVAAGAPVLDLEGPARGLLEAERTALNFLQRLSGVATLSRRFADAVAGTAARVVDTRKTTPGWRALEKAAVAAGGCHNHRFDLGAGVLIKDNHIAVAGSVAAAVTAARARAPHSLRVECEVDTLDQLDEALSAGADIVLCDNMTPEQVARAVERAHARGVLVEVSGGITLATAPEYARAGADVISAGALTHSAPAVDLGMDLHG